VAEGLERPAQYDDTPETLAALAEAAEAAEKDLDADAGLFRLRLGYAAAGFSTALINNVFILYHLKLYTSVYRVSDSWLYLVFVVYGIWNTLNDPLFGWIEDRSARGSLRNSLQRRLFALRVGGLLLSVTFFALFTPWWDVSPAAPPPSPWLVGIHMLVCMSCYDAGLTWVCQAHNALLAELTVDNEERAALGRYSSIAMMCGSGSALSAFYAWNNLSYQGYQTVCLGLALLGAGAFELSYWLLSATESFNAPAADSWEAAAEGGSGHSGDQAYGDSDAGSERVAMRTGANERGGVFAETIEFGRFARTAVQSRSLGLFLVFGLCQQLNCTFNTSFFPLMVEVLLVGELPGWVSTVVLLSSFVLPHFLTIFSTQLAGRLKECYPIIKTLNVLKVLNSMGMLLGTTLFPLPPAQCGWLILTGMIVNRNVTECGCRLSSLVLADIIDEDRALHGRYADNLHEANDQQLAMRPLPQSYSPYFRASSLPCSQI
jgi:Na+/melibiose symporter-like transporter